MDQAVAGDGGLGVGGTARVITAMGAKKRAQQIAVTTDQEDEEFAHRFASRRQ